MWWEYRRKLGLDEGKEVKMISNTGLLTAGEPGNKVCATKFTDLNPKWTIRCSWVPKAQKLEMKCTCWSQGRILWLIQSFFSKILLLLSFCASFGRENPWSYACHCWDIFLLFIFHLIPLSSSFTALDFYCMLLSNICTVFSNLSNVYLYLLSSAKNF